MLLDLSKRHLSLQMHGVLLQSCVVLGSSCSPKVTKQTIIFILGKHLLLNDSQMPLEVLDWRCEDLLLEVEIHLHEHLELLIPRESLVQVVIVHFHTQLGI